MVDEIGRLVEEHLAQPAPHDHPEDPVEEQVVYLAGVPAQFGTSRRVASPQNHEEHERGEVHEAVPADAEAIGELPNEWIEVVCPD